MAKNLTTKEFIKKLKNKHGNAFDYSFVEYKNKDSNIILICKEHNIKFEIKAWKALQYKYPCEICRKEKFQSTKQTQEEIINRFKSVHGDFYCYDKVEFINTETRVEIICPIHGSFYQLPRLHYSGSGCPFCTNERNSKSKSDTTETFILKARKVHGNKYSYEKVVYVNSQTKVCIICPIHGEFWQIPASHIKGYGCSICGREVVAKKMKLTKNEFINRANKKYGELYDYSKVEYIDYHTPVCIICPIHGEFWQSPGNHLYGFGCKYCANNVTLTTDQFIKKSLDKFGSFLDYSKVNYKNSKEKVTLICPIHGEFQQSPYKHLSGICPCPMCTRDRESSQPEKDLGFFVNSIYKGKVITNIKDIINHGYELDVYIPDLNLAFEFNGCYWHSYEYNIKNQYKHINKTKLCEEKGIKLFHVWENDWNERKELIEDKIRRIFDNKNLKIPTDKIVEIDRSWPEFDKDEMQFCGYELIEEQEPNSFEYKDKYTLFDCGKLIYKKVE